MPREGPIGSFRQWRKDGYCDRRCEGSGTPGPTELVLGRAATNIFDALPEDVRTLVPEVPTLIRRLERDAEILRRVGNTGENLTQAVAALENLRVGMLRVQAGAGSVKDLTLHLERAQEVGDRIDAELLGREDVERLLE